MVCELFRSIWNIGECCLASPKTNKERNFVTIKTETSLKVKPFFSQMQSLPGSNTQQDEKINPPEDADIEIVRRNKIKHIKLMREEAIKKEQISQQERLRARQLQFLNDMEFVRLELQRELPSNFLSSDENGISQHDKLAQDEIKQGDSVRVQNSVVEQSTKSLEHQGSIQQNISYRNSKDMSKVQKPNNIVAPQAIMTDRISSFLTIVTPPQKMKFKNDQDWMKKDSGV